MAMEKVPPPALRFLLGSLLWLAATLAHAADDRGENRNVVLVTLDGVRVQEIFGGLDADILRSTLGEGQELATHPAYLRYWADTPEARREKLMPFFWGTLMRRHGSIAGNPQRGSHVRLGNRMRFSYPGYAELLTGRAHDDTIDSNDKRQQPFPTVLEFVRRKLDLPREKVAVFGSWDRFAVMAERTPGALFVNAGFMPYASADPRIQALSDTQEDASAWDEERFDAFTRPFALAHLQSARPRLLYVGLGDTDEWSHARDYSRTLAALHQTDDFLRELWAWLQSQPQYRDRTTLIVTTDHGRGRTPKDWSDHGPGLEGAQDIWIAIAGPGHARRGEWSGGPLLRQGQVAATIAAEFGLDYSQQDAEAYPSIDDAP